MATPKAPPENTLVLDQYRCMEIVGADAMTFLQGQVSSDLSDLPMGGGQLSTFNDPQGRVIAMLRIFKTADGFVALVPDEIAGPVMTRLKMFVMRSRVAIESGTRWRVLGIHGHGQPSGVPSMRLDVTEPLCIAIQGEVDSSISADRGEWDALETACGMPEVYAATSGHFVPQMLRLDRFGAVSFTKGCYVGQEVIARAHHLGRIKRHTRLFRATDGRVAPGQPVSKAHDKIGEVVRTASHGNDLLVLAVVRDDAEGPFSAGGHDLESLPDPAAFC